MDRPAKTSGLRHVALFVPDLHSAELFYTRLMGMEVEWRPDKENVYLTSGNDNLALHQHGGEFGRESRLDHIGFFINQIEEVDDWYDYLTAEGVAMLTEPRTHRDGARSFYCSDPAGNRVQIIYHPPIANAEEQETR